MIDFLISRFKKEVSTKANKGFNAPLAPLISCPQRDKSGSIACEVNCASSEDSCVVNEIKQVWLKAGIPTVVDKNISKKVENLHKDWQNLKKNCNKSSKSDAIK